MPIIILIALILVIALATRKTSPVSLSAREVEFNQIVAYEDKRKAYFNRKLAEATTEAEIEEIEYEYVHGK